MTRPLSKSKLMTGLQCPKALYLEVRHPRLKAEASVGQQAQFKEGHEVGHAAQLCFPGGVLIEAPYFDTAKAIAETRDAIENGADTVFEATFLAGDAFAKIDILHRKTKRSGWDLIEVKKATSVKTQYLDDVAIQTHVAKKAGLKLASSQVMHINNKCVAPRLENLFTQRDVTDEIKVRLKTLPKTICEMQTMLARPKPPDVDIGPHCDVPYECAFKAHCRQEKKIPKLSIFELPGISSTKLWQYYNDGVVRVDDPKFGPFKGKVAEQVRAAVTGKPWIDTHVIRAELKKWKWPLYFLDFETIGFAIPRWNGTHPYQQIPFQFSLHIQPAPGAPLVHVEYLHADASDPRESLAQALIAAIGERGNIVAYNKSFEASVMRGLNLSTAVDRLVDPLPIFRAAVYDAGFLGSFGIKSVAPALLGEQSSYEGMLVADGQGAQQAYLEMISVETALKRRAELRAALIAYCRKDTAEMVGLVEWLLAR